uniref:Uncharacterized protein n=1 Tax=Panagrolaimus sp. PS1159 TaxID=55785 RepID=A0AC35GMV9_9BILA
MALESSESVVDFVENIDAVKRLDKKLERKLNEIINSLNVLKGMIDDLKFSLDVKYFNTEVKHPTKHIFSSVKTFLENPTNFTRNQLIKKCNKHPPLDILEL